MKKIFEKIILILAFAFYVFMIANNLMNSPLSIDEWTIYKNMSYPLFSFDGKNVLMGTIDNRAPLFYILLKFYMMINSSLLWFRLLNVFISVISGIVFIKIIKLFYSNIVASISIIMLSMAYKFIYLTQSVEEYALAIMLIFLIIYSYFTLKKKRDYIVFIIICVLSCYTFYGSAFVVFPLIVYSILKYFKNVSNKNKIKTILLFIIPSIISILPLFYFYILRVIEAYKIFENNHRITEAFLQELSLTFGRVALYPYNMMEYTSYQDVWSFVGFLFLLSMLYLLIVKTTDREQKNFIMASFIIFVLYFYFVHTNMYGFTEKDTVATFYNTQSYFLIPVFATLLPMLFVGVFRAVKHDFLFCGYYICFVMLILFIPGYSIYLTLFNWKKTDDDTMSKILIEKNVDERSPIYLFGENPGYEYYVNDKYHFRKIFDYELNDEELPDKFYVYVVDCGPGNHKVVNDRRTNITSEDNCRVLEDLFYKIKRFSYKEEILNDNFDNQLRLYTKIK